MKTDTTINRKIKPSLIPILTDEKYLTHMEEASNGDILYVTFSWSRDSLSVDNISVRFFSKKTNSFTDMTTMFTYPNSMYSFIDTIIDNTIKNQ